MDPSFLQPRAANPARTLSPVRKHSPRPQHLHLHPDPPPAPPQWSSGCLPALQPRTQPPNPQLPVPVADFTCVHQCPWPLGSSPAAGQAQGHLAGWHPSVFRGSPLTRHAPATSAAWPAHTASPVSAAGHITVPSFSTDWLPPPPVIALCTPQLSPEASLCLSVPPAIRKVRHTLTPVPRPTEWATLRGAFCQTTHRAPMGSLAWAP